MPSCTPSISFLKGSLPLSLQHPVTHPPKSLWSALDTRPLPRLIHACWIPSTSSRCPSAFPSALHLHIQASCQVNNLLSLYGSPDEPHACNDMSSLLLLHAHGARGILGSMRINLKEPHGKLDFSSEWYWVCMSWSPDIDCSMQSGRQYRRALYASQAAFGRQMHACVLRMPMT